VQAKSIGFCYAAPVFSLLKKTAIGRRGLLRTLHGEIASPFFMPVATAGAMKGITHDDLRALGAQILLCNTYHLHLHPGEDVIADAGGLHTFIHWEKPILTDSGGFQVFSLSSLRSIDDDRVVFRSHVDGSEHILTPESAMEIQHKLGSDIILCLDHCPPSTASRTEIMKATDRTLLWAKRCHERHDKLCQKGHRPLLFCVIQGGLERDLREKCAQELIAMGFDGYAVGGLAVGETQDEMYGVIDALCPLLPADRPRYLMGVGVIEQLKACVAKGIDMFDCVLPMRIARHSKILLSTGFSIDIDKSIYRNDHTPIDALSPSPLSRLHTRSYLHHLMKTKERYGETIACMQNLAVTLEAMRTLRADIEQEPC
jgi:queuine tRNA-ribosyltransferase